MLKPVAGIAVALAVLPSVVSTAGAAAEPERTTGGEDTLLFRTGVAYEVELAERWALIPEFNVDFVDGQQSYVLGVSVGLGF
jgi:hypothetical protein